MSKTNSAAAVFSVLEFSKRFTPNSKDPVRECCEFLAKLKVNPADAGVIKDSSGGMIWFTSDGIARLNSYIQGQGLPPVSNMTSNTPINNTSTLPDVNTKTHNTNNHNRSSPAQGETIETRSAIKIQRVWRRFNSVRKLQKRSRKVNRHERKESQPRRKQISAKDHISNLSREYHEMIQNPKQEKELLFIKLLNSAETFQAAVELNTDSVAATSNKDSTSFIYQKLSQKFIEWLNPTLNTNYQISANVIEILKTGNILCQLVVKLFPSTECQLLEKGVEFSIHKVIYFMEFCRCVGITGVFKVSDLIPCLVKDESSSGIAIFRTVSNLESKAQSIGNWSGPFFEQDSILKEEPEKMLTDPVNKRSSIIVHFDAKNLDFTPMNNESPKKSPTEGQIGSRRISAQPHKGPFARLREKRATRMNSSLASNQLSDKNHNNPEMPETNEEPEKSDSSVTKRDTFPRSGSLQVKNDAAPKSNSLPLKNDVTPKSDSRPLKRDLAPKSDFLSVKGDSSSLDRYFSISSDRGLKQQPTENKSVAVNGKKSDIELSAIPKRPESAKEEKKSASMNQESSPKFLPSFWNRSRATDSVQSGGSDSEAISHRKESPAPPLKTNHVLRTGTSAKDSHISAVSSNDTTVSHDSNSVNGTSSIGPTGISNSMGGNSKAVLKIAANERVFATIMSHLVQFLDTLAKNKQNEIDKIGLDGDQSKGDISLESYSSNILALINTERLKNESDVWYVNRLKVEIEELSQSRDIALAVMALHRRLTKTITEHLEEMKSQKASSNSLGNFFMNFASDMLTPYVRYAVTFFDSQSRSSKEFISPSNPEDLQNAVDFIKTFIKVQNDKRPVIQKEQWEKFLKFPLQRLHNYADILDNTIAFSNRSPTDIDNRKLKIAKLKILAAFHTIRERFE